MNCRVLIIGSSGALGRSLVKHFDGSTEGFTVFAPKRTGSGELLDLSDCNQIARCIERTKPNLIFHLATSFSNEYDEAYKVNVRAVRQILDSVEAIAQSTRVVLIGSAAEYGAVRIGDNPIREDHPLHPVSIYGLTKAWQTQLAYLYAARGVNVVVARIFNLLGSDLSERLFVGRVHKQIDEFRRGLRSHIEVGPLSSIRDYITIENAIAQLLLIAEFGEIGEVYHVASGQPISMRELLVNELLPHGLDLSIVHEGTGLTNRTGYDVPSIYADINKTCSLSNMKSYVKN